MRKPLFNQRSYVTLIFQIKIMLKIKQNKPRNILNWEEVGFS